MFKNVIRDPIRRAGRSRPGRVGILHIGLFGLFVLTSLIACAANSAPSPGDSIDLLEYYPIGPRGDYRIVMMNDGFDLTLEQVKYSEPAANGVFSSQEVHGHSVITMYYKVYASGIYESDTAGDLKEDLSMLAFPAQANIGHKWHVRNGDNILEARLVSRLNSCGGVPGDYVKLEYAPVINGHAERAFIEEILEKGVGPVMMKWISGFESPGKGTIWLGMSDAFILKASK